MLRSRFLPNPTYEADKLMGQCARRIIEQAPKGVKLDGASEDDLKVSNGALRNGPGAGDSISLSWPAAREDDNRKLRLDMFRNAVWEVMEGLKRGEESFRSLPCLRVLTTCFVKLPSFFPAYALMDFAFDESHRRELLDHGILKQVPLDTLANGSRSWDDVFTRLCFRSPTLSSDPWNASCEHKRKGNWEGPNQDWSTKPTVAYLRHHLTCSYCVQRFNHHLKTRPPSHLVTTCDLTPTDAMAELRFVDPDDGVSEWVYHFSTCMDTAEEEEEEEQSSETSIN